MLELLALLLMLLPVLGTCLVDENLEIQPGVYRVRLLDDVQQPAQGLLHRILLHARERCIRKRKVT